MDSDFSLPFDSLSLDNDDFMQLLDDLIDFDSEFSDANSSIDYNAHIEESKSQTNSDTLVTIDKSIEALAILLRPSNIRTINKGRISPTFSQDITNAVNKGDIRLISRILNDSLHSKCVFLL